MHTALRLDLLPDCFNPGLDKLDKLDKLLCLLKNITGKNKTRGRNSTVNSDTHYLLEAQLEGILITSFIMTRSNARDTKTWGDELNYPVL